METIKQYAVRHQVSYEAIRKQVERYQKDLEGHIFQKGKAKYLDDDAVAFLDARRRDSPVIVYEQERKEIEKALQEEVDRLRLYAIELQNKIIDLQAETMKYIETKALYAALLETDKKTTSELEAMRLQHTDDLVKIGIAEERLTALEARREVDRETIEQLTIEKNNAVAVADGFEKTWFGLYRKRQ